MTEQSRIAAFLAPVVFLLHVAEEAPGFVEWFNSLVARGISQPLFLSVNAVAFIITVALAGSLSAARNPGIAALMLAWLGFLMLANAGFHLVATVVHERYCPGVVTAAVLYLPYFAWFFRVSVRSFRVRIPTAIAVAFLGTIPMVIHGYLIVFRGNRLF